MKNINSLMQDEPFLKSSTKDWVKSFIVVDFQSLQSEVNHASFSPNNNNICHTWVCPTRGGSVRQHPTRRYLPCMGPQRVAESPTVSFLIHSWQGRTMNNQHLIVFCQESQVDNCCVSCVL